MLITLYMNSYRLYLSIDVDLSGSGKRTTKIVEVETENGTVHDESLVANELNDFFTKILGQLGKDHYSSDSVSDDSKLKKFISSRLCPTTRFVK